MATIVKTPSNTWKAVIRKNGWPTSVKTFRTKRDAEDRSRRTEDAMARGTYIQRATADRMTVESAVDRYVKEVTPTKLPPSHEGEQRRDEILKRHRSGICPTRCRRTLDGKNFEVRMLPYGPRRRLIIAWLPEISLHASANSGPLTAICMSRRPLRHDIS